MDNPSMADVLAEYGKAVDAARAECDKVVTAARAEYDKVRAAAYAEYGKVLNAIWDECDKVLNAAWVDMATKTSDPLALWIIKNCSERQEEALIVLEALPASLEELNEIANEYGWCGDWDEFVAQAQADGVI